MIGETRIFVSYARVDSELCEAVCRILRENACSCFVDSEGTLLGEQFPERIRAEVERADGLVALLTPRAVASEWCRAELYHAFALGTPVAPILIGTTLKTMPGPIELLMRDRNYLEVAKDEDLNGAELTSVGRALVDSLALARRRGRQRVRRMLGRVAAVVLGIGLLGAFIPERVNAWSRASGRQQTIDRLLASETVLSEQSASELAAAHAGDDELSARLKMIESDGERSDLQRVNASLLATTLLASRAGDQRRYLDGVAWSDTVFRGHEFTQMTLSAGNIDRVSFERSTFSAVAWGPGPLDGDEADSGNGLSVTGVVFEDCQFAAGEFFGTELISVEFVNTRLRGTKLDLTAFHDVAFETRTADPTGTVISSDLTVLVRCVVARCPDDEAASEDQQALDSDARQTLVITPALYGTRFDRVVFDDCILRGDLPAEWFTDCNFTNCVLPPSMSQAALESGGNTVSGSTWFEPHCW